MMYLKPNTQYYLREDTRDYGYYARRHDYTDHDYSYCPYCGNRYSYFHNIDRCRESVESNRIIVTIICVTIVIVMVLYARH